MKHLRYITAIAFVFALTATLPWRVYLSVRQARLDGALVVACKRLDSVSISQLLNDGANPNTYDSTHSREPTFLERLRNIFTRRDRFAQDTPQALQVAFNAAIDARTAPTAMVQILLDHGANPNVRDNEGSLLCQSWRYQHKLCFAALINHGAAFRVDEGDDLLVRCCMEDDLSSVRLLLQHGANANADSAAMDLQFSGDGRINGYHSSALMIAAWNQNPAMVKLLIQYGADATRIDPHGVPTLRRLEPGDYWTAEAGNSHKLNA